MKKELKKMVMSNAQGKELYDRMRVMLEAILGRKLTNSEQYLSDLISIAYKERDNTGTMDVFNCVPIDMGWLTDMMVPLQTMLFLICNGDDIANLAMAMDLTSRLTYQKTE